jgi:hypothetical protein
VTYQFHLSPIEDIKFLDLNRVQYRLLDVQRCDGDYTATTGEFNLILTF